MSEKIALFGAGGKMGVRVSQNLAKTDFDVAHVEVSEAGRARLTAETGFHCVEQDVALENAKIVILAVPDTVLGRVAHNVVPKLKPGAMVVVLDAAAPFAGHLPTRGDISYFVTHPSHPSIFNYGTTQAELHDHFGGVAAPQSVVSALMQGPEADYALGERVARAIYAPVVRAYRVTVDQMALLEPGLSETVCATLLAVMRDAMDAVVARGVPRDCARDFLLGHMNILAAVTFDEMQGQFSDACNKAITFGKPRLMRDDWIKCLDNDEIVESIRRIT